MVARRGQLPGHRVGTVDRSVTGVVLAGGKSTRLGRDKALLRVDAGPTLIGLAVERLRELVAEVVVVADEHERLGQLAARMVPDVYPGRGVLGGIYSGLVAARHQHVLVVGCDMPFLSPRLLSYLLALPRDYDLLLPRHGAGLLEPLHAVYSRTCREVIQRQLLARRYSAIGYLDEVRVRYVEEAELRQVDPELRSFFNVNTAEDLRRALEMARESEPRP